VFVKKTELIHLGFYPGKTKKELAPFKAYYFFDEGNN